MTVIAGIDEAGFGPVLGPMVVSAVAFSMPPELAEVSMWRLLEAAVCRKPSRRGGKIAINDSKLLYSGLRTKEALGNLERGVLAMLAAGRRPPDSLRKLLAEVSPRGAEAMKDYPWYAGCDLTLPHNLSATDVALSANAIATLMRQAGVSMADASVEAVQVGEYNRLVAAARNKSSVLFDVTCRLLMRLWQKQAKGLLKVYVDRQGGRVHYLPALQRVFHGCSFKVIEEDDRLSAYRLSEGSRCAEIIFLVGGEQHQLPVALASMISKYLRELFMVLFNRFWGMHVPGIAPTAGYYKDGNRFYGQIRARLAELGLEHGLVYRCR